MHLRRVGVVDVFPLAGAINIERELDTAQALEQLRESGQAA